MASDYTDGYFRHIHKDLNKNNNIWRYTETLALKTSALSVHWEYNTSCLSVDDFKTVTPRVKHIDINVCFLQEKPTIHFLFQKM